MRAHLAPWLLLLALTLAPQPRVAAAADPPALRIGDACPDLELLRLGGGRLRLRLRALRGRAVALTFYSRHCAPCRRELPTLARVVDRLNALRVAPGAPAATPAVALLVINIDEQPEERAVLTRLGGPAAVWLLDGDGRARRAFDPQRYPCTFLVDAAGRVRHINRGFGPGYEARVERWLRAMLGPPGGRPRP